MRYLASRLRHHRLLSRGLFLLNTRKVFFCAFGLQCCAFGLPQQGNLDDYNTLGTISTIGFIAGGVIAAAGLVLILVAPSGGTEEGATLTLSPTGFDATIRF